jgi:nucleoside-diphosphate-sugar epimerase
MHARAGACNPHQIRTALIHADIGPRVEQGVAGLAGNREGLVHEAIVGRQQRVRKPVRFLQSRRRGASYIGAMKILITGATGKVGSRLARRLVRQGHSIRALVRDPARSAALLGDQMEFFEGDLLDPDSLGAAVRGTAAIVHCAAFFRGATPEQAHAVNEGGTQHLASAARNAKVGRFVFLSTGLTYGPNGGRLAAEDHACNPVDAYPLSKLAAERILLDMQGLDARILRLPFVYGDGDPHIEEAIPFMRGFPPGQRMSIGHHVDVAQAVSRLLNVASPSHRIYNVVDDEAPELAALFAAVGQPPPDGTNAERALAFGALLDGSRIREDLGFKPVFPRLEDTLKANALDKSWPE